MLLILQFSKFEKEIPMQALAFSNGSLYFVPCSSVSKSNQTPSVTLSNQMGGVTKMKQIDHLIHRWI